MKVLREKGYAEPLKRYIASGKPYMGICIGMQTLCESSEESDEPGLGVIPGSCRKFTSTSKTVPHIGWNGAIPLKASGESVEIDESIRYGFVDGTSYYFVHSYQLPFDESLSEWALTATQYGDETFISTAQKGNVLATQFHPEKSGQAGQNILHAWLSQTGVITPSLTHTIPISSKREALKTNGLTKRVVACLDVRTNDAGDLVVTKGDQYDVRETSSTGAVRNLGKPVDLARRYYDEGADEIAFLNITSFRSSALQDQPMLEVVAKSAETVFVPLTIGGGIRDTVDPDGTKRSAVEVAGAYFRAGADKVSIGSDAVFAVEEMLQSGSKSGKTGIEMIAYRYGNQAVVVSVDPKRVYAKSREEVDQKHQACVVDLSDSMGKKEEGPNGERYCWYQCTVSGGREVRDLDVVQLCQGVQALGAGEILLNSVDRDGSKAGFDLRLVNLVKSSVSIPVIASSGAGKPEDFEEVFVKTNVEAALAAGIFHRQEVPLQDVKEHMRSVGVQTRKDLQS